jgi:predicted HTH transcriptional regulator
VNEYIKQRIAEGEHQQQDFKFEISDASKIARSLSAFSNTDGGRLLVGVKDNGVIAGVRSDEEYYMVESAASLFCEPEVAFDYKTWDIEGKMVFEVTIPRRTGELVKAPDKNREMKVYLRREDQNILANGIFVLADRLKNQPEGIVLEYSESEKDLLNYLSVHQQVFFNQYRKSAHLGFHKARSLFVKLLALEVIRIDYDGKNYFYTLSEKG